MSTLMLLGVVVTVLIDPQHAWMREESKVERLDVTSTFLMGANTIGVIAALLTLVMLSRFILLLKCRYLVGCLIFLMLCYAARSRTGFIVLILGALVLTGVLLRMPSRRMIAGIGGILLSILAFGLLLVSQEFADAVTSSFTRGHSEENIKSLDGRMTIWAAALEGFEQSPLLGSGYATYPIQIKGGGHFHNMFIELAVTTGLLGLIPILILFALLGTRLIKLFLSKPTGAACSSIESLDALLIGTVVIVSEMTTAGAAYYSWQMIGIVALAVGLHSMFDNSNPNGEAKCNLEVHRPMHTLVSAHGGVLTTDSDKRPIIY
jgi:O-antigen ligase